MPKLATVTPINMVSQLRRERQLEEREHLRLELKAREYIHAVHETIDILRAGREAFVMEDGTSHWVPLDRHRTMALKAASDMALRLLDRVLPPLKAVEIGPGPENQADPAQLTTTELLKMVGKMPSTLEGEFEEEVAAEPVKPPWE